MTAIALVPQHRKHDTYNRLIEQFRARATEDTEERWRWLMAAHIVGQNDIRLHAHSHWMMLKLALRTRDWKEAAGQLFRLALVPIGHALNKLPAGNIGRATVNAFRPMTVSPEMRLRIAQARAPRPAAR